MTQHISPVSDPVAGWGNDDLLISDHSRDELGRRDPALLALLDWPELRARFRRHDAPSNAARKQLRRSGKALLLLTFVGLVSGVAAQWFNTLLMKQLALVIGTLAALAGLYIWLHGHSRTTWLVNRIWTERMRQLFFQTLICNLDKAGAALAELSAVSGGAAVPGPALTAWHGIRAQALLRLESLLARNEAHAIDRLAGDKAEVQTWISPEWADVVPPASTPEVDRLIALLGHQRIGIQLEYTQKKIREGTASPVSQRNWIRMLSVVFSLLAVMLGLAVFPLLAMSLAKVPVTHWLDQLVIAQMTCTGAVVLLGAIDKALAITEDADRYEWYLAVLENIDDRYQHANDGAGRIAALRFLEETTYAEMRRFFVTHKSARTFA